MVLCSDSRGSASLNKFAEAFPKQFVEVGIAEQNLVSISAGLAACGKKPFASPACFLSTRSMEQVKVDVAYSCTNQCRQLSEQKALKHGFSAVMEAHIARYFAG